MITKSTPPVIFRLLDYSGPDRIKKIGDREQETGNSGKKEC